MAGFFSSERAAPAPLTLLLRVNLVQNWRRLKSIRQQSRLLTSVIGLFIVGYVGLSFWLFYRGLKFVATFPGLGTLLTERLLFLLFAFLFGLLLLSNLVIIYQPVSCARQLSCDSADLFANHFAGICGINSAGFVGVPVLRLLLIIGAYGLAAPVAFLSGDACPHRPVHSSGGCWVLSLLMSRIPGSTNFK
jgi:hypothetical protein